MTVHPISPASVALYITPADLKEHGLTPGTLTPERALTLARAAFAEAGVEPAGSIEIEAFPDACGVLVFAQVRPQGEVCFAFPDCEALIRAVQVLPMPAGESALDWWDGAFWLSIPSCAPRAAAILSEFAREAASDPWLARRLAEHGHAILRGDAVAQLKKHFPQ